MDQEFLLKQMRLLQKLIEEDDDCISQENLLEVQNLIDYIINYIEKEGKVWERLY